MSSIVSGFEYDIFISYRQKDNKGERWVTEFVNALKSELESTFKEDVSIYFDENPHDGLLETHDVDDSLKDKLKCLIFIPIISQTYCDPKSFAWKNEFLAFKKTAVEDIFGLKVKLLSGNVASRVLPIRIHEIDSTDQKLLDDELQGKLRAIDFIYHSAGVNRPLTPKDERELNLNKIFYRDQINKVANSIKEIIAGLQAPKKVIEASTATNSQTKPSVPKKSKWVAIAAFLLLALLAGWWFNNRASTPIISQSIKESRIAVLPFENKTNDAELDMLGDMAADFITQGLMDLDMKVVTPRSTQENMKLASLTNGGEISPDFVQRTGAETLVTGRFYKHGEELIFQIQISDALSGEVVTAVPEIKGKKADLHGLVTELRERLLTAFSIKPSNSILSSKASPPKFEAYKIFEEAMKNYGEDNDYEHSKKLLKQAISEDSSFAMAYILTGFLYKQQNDWPRSDSMIREVDLRFPHLSTYESLVLEQLRADLYGSLEDAYEQAKKGFSKDPKDFLFNHELIVFASFVNKPAEVLKVFGQIDPSLVDFSNELQILRANFYAGALMRHNQLDDAKKILQNIPIEKMSAEIIGTMAFLHALQHQEDSIDFLIRDLEKRGMDKKRLARVCEVISICVASKKELEGQVSFWAKRSLAYLNQSNLKEKESRELASALYLSGQLPSALEMYERLNSRNPDTYLLSTIGCIYAKLGKDDKAREQIRKIEVLDNQYNWPHIYYPTARIHAALGEKEKAMNFLRLAFKEEIGSLFYFVWDIDDYELINLYEYPPYQELRKPKG